MVKVAGALEPPPPPPVQGVMQPGRGEDGGLKTVTVAEPGFERRFAATVAWIWQEVPAVQLTLVIANFACVPPIVQFTWEPPEESVVGRKLAPFNVEPLSINVNCGLPAGALVGLMLARAGGGLGGGLI